MLFNSSTCPPSPQYAKPLLYAELLTNIRQVSVMATLSSFRDDSTTAELLDDGHSFMVTHRGKSTVLALPEQVQSHTQAQELPQGSMDLSWRFPLANMSTPRNASTQENEVPWSARDLTPDVEFSCRDCDSVIIKKESIKEWKNLPSENWAEMMEFWHCHKPDVPTHEQNGPVDGSNDHKGHDDTHANVDRGYGANTKFIARTSVGFVDPTTFLLASADCSNVKGLEVRYTLHQFGCSFLFTGCFAGVSRRWPYMLLLFNCLITDTNTPN